MIDTLGGVLIFPEWMEISMPIYRVKLWRGWPLSRQGLELRYIPQSFRNLCPPIDFGHLFLEEDAMMA